MNFCGQFRLGYTHSWTLWLTWLSGWSRPRMNDDDDLLGPKKRIDWLHIIYWTGPRSWLEGKWPKKNASRKSGPKRDINLNLVGTMWRMVWWQGPKIKGPVIDGLIDSPRLVVVVVVPSPSLSSSSLFASIGPLFWRTNHYEIGQNQATFCAQHLPLCHSSIWSGHSF